MTTLERSLLASIAAKVHADQIEAGILVAVRIGCPDEIAAKVGLAKLTRLHGEELPAKTRAVALMIYRARAGELRQGIGIREGVTS